MFLLKNCVYTPLVPLNKKKTNEDEEQNANDKGNNEDNPNLE